MSHETPGQAFRLAPMQQGILFEHLSGEHPGGNIQQIVAELREEIDPKHFRAAWERVVERHGAFRTSFQWEDRGEPLQVVSDPADAATDLPLTIDSWERLPGQDLNRRVRDYLREDRARGFDLSRRPLFRLALFRLGPGDHRFIWTFHHILMDGRSFTIVLKEVFEIYEALRDGGEPHLPEPAPFRRHVEYLERRDAADDEAFWRDALQGSAPGAAPSFAGPAGAEPRDRGLVAAKGEVEASLSRRVSDRLRALAEEHEFTLNNLVQGAWALMLERQRDDGEDEAAGRSITFGAARACRHSTVEDADRMVGVLMNTLPIRIEVEPGRRVLDWLEELRARQLALRPHEHTPLARIQGWCGAPGTPLFRSLIVYDHERLDTALHAGREWRNRTFRIVEQTNVPLTLYAYGEDRVLLRIAYHRDEFGRARVERMLDHLVTLLRAMTADPDRELGDLPPLGDRERERTLVDWNDTRVEDVPELCLHELFERRARRTPDAEALIYRGESLTYGEVSRRSERLAGRLRDLDVGRGSVVGILLERSVESVIAVLAIHRAGGAYLPLDPDHPKRRLEFMIRDAGASVLLSRSGLADLIPESDARVLHLDALDSDTDATPRDGEAAEREAARPDDLAYIAYTSGSTGRPKGVMVEHRQVVNFFAGMDRSLDIETSGTWLALTSLSFDISVLELFWTLTRGFRVVIAPEETLPSRTSRALRPGSPRTNGGSAPASGAAENETGEGPDFSLFFFAGDEGSDERKYDLLLRAARFADERGFHAIWTPERHFHSFGALYPNPSVAGAALAAATRSIGIRAGSVVLPLHDPLRVAEEWSVVDNLSDGRVGLSFASGWQPEDFILGATDYEDRKSAMYDGIEQVRRLWRGAPITREGPDGEPIEVRTYPTPVQEELPVWVTAAGNPETFRRAGEIGAHLLTHLLGHDIEELEEKIEIYRRARRKHGHGPGRVTLMLHTFLGESDEAVREIVRSPLKKYLGNSVSLMKKYAGTWTAYSGGGEEPLPATGDEFERLSSEDMESLLEHALDRYVETSGLFGTPESCVPMVEKLREIGVDEIGSLIDFGVDSESVLASLEHLAELRERCRRPSPGADESGEGKNERDPAESIGELVRRHEVTHAQCTPSLARLLLADPDSREAVGELRALLVGGERLDAELAAELLSSGVGALFNMYGPTETTVWSTTHRVTDADGPVPIGRPIANTRVHVLDASMRPVPIGVPGELHIGGAGVARGYHARPELTAERFVPDPFAAAEGDGTSGGRLYRTGDRVRWREDGTLAFLGRMDEQVKIRGHRVEPGEIDAAMVAHPDVRGAVTLARPAENGDVRLASWVEVPATANGSRDAAVEEIRTFLGERLPGHMIPSSVVPLRRLPLMPNGKVDRAALLRGDHEDDGAGSQGPSGGLALPEARGSTEERVKAIWKEVLGVERVGPDDDFFDLGGNSLSTIQIVFRIRETLGVDLPLRTIFDAPTVAGLAARIDRELLQGADEGELRALLDEMDDISDAEAAELLSGGAS